MSIIRSLAFYLAFYIGSIVPVSLAAAATFLAPKKVIAAADLWSNYHRFCVRYILGIKVVETGDKRSGPYLYAVKHEAFFEAIDLPTALDKPVGFAKKELYKIPGWGRAATAYGVIPVSREDGAKALRNMVKSAKSYADSGRPLTIFPEGTRAPRGTWLPIQAGFVALYKTLKIPVIPVAVNSGLTYQGTWKRSGTITLHFGDPIEPGLPRDEIERLVLEGINVLNEPRDTPASDEPVDNKTER